MALSVLVSGEKEPVPLVIHAPPPALEMLPFSCTPEVSAHTEMSNPAVATGAVAKPTTMLSISAGQPPGFPVEVKVSVTDPAVVSAELGLYVVMRESGLGVNVPLPELVQVPPPAN